MIMYCRFNSVYKNYLHLCMVHKPSVDTEFHFRKYCNRHNRVDVLTLKVLVATIDAQWEGMGDVGSARYEPALLPPCPTIRVLSYSN